MSELHDSIFYRLADASGSLEVARILAPRLRATNPDTRFKRNRIITALDNLQEAVRQITHDIDELGAL